jgi:hypothetical protein
METDERSKVIETKGVVIEDCTSLLTALNNYDSSMYDQHKATISEFMRYLTHELKVW